MRQLLRENPDMRWLFIAQVVSFMGDWFTFVAIGGMVQDATGSAFLVSLVLVAFSLPSFLMSPVAGPLVDRVDRRRLLMIVSAGQAVCAAGLLLAAPDRIWVLFVFQGAISALAAIVKPAIDAGVPNVARNEGELRAANTLLGSTWGVMLAVGAGLGGVFSQAFGRRACFVADGVSFLVALALFGLIRRPMQEPRGEHHRARMRPIADTREALRYAQQDRVVLALLASKATFAIGAGVVGLLPVLASDSFGWGDDGRGLLLGARGLGAGLGPVIAARFTRDDVSRVLRVCGWSGLIFSVCYLAVSGAPIIFVAALFITIAHLGGGAQWTLSTYGLQLRTTDEIRGRVMAGDFAIVTLVLSVTSLGAGLLAEVIGVRWTIAAFAAAAALAGTAYLTATNRLLAGLAALPPPDPVPATRVS
jgi:predicted MFS family arabinose efflux permease